MIAIPCYNYENQVPRVLGDLVTLVNQDPRIISAVVVDNQSKDGTLKAAVRAVQDLGFSKPVRVYQNVENFGLGGTHKVAWQLALQSGATHLAIAHGDHQETPSELAELISISSLRGEITTLGSRFNRQSRLHGYSPTRIYGNRVLNLAYTALSGRTVEDLGSGLNLFRLSDIELSRLMKFTDGFTFNMDLLLELIRSGAEFVYTPISWSTTDQVSNARSLSVGSKALERLISWRLSRFGVKPNLAVREAYASRALFSNGK